MSRQILEEVHPPRPLPAPLLPLLELALDLRWTWSHAADALWRTIDRDMWEATRNPWYLLQNLSATRLEAAAADPVFVDALRRLDEERREHLRGPSLGSGQIAGLEGGPIAYFSMEFGLGEAIPLYAGGLGILAGDLLKAASDLGLPVVGVGILFQEGYFRQTLDADGWQHEAYPYNDPATLPLRPVRSPDGARLRVSLEVEGRTLWLRAWLVNVGRARLYLLDANDLLNRPADRGITGKLYDGATEVRLLQQLVLGVGGWRLLAALGLEPTIAHLNEGHAAFAVLERARAFMERSGASFREALWATRIGNVFTTHTPVAAAFDRFDPLLLERQVLSPRGALGDLGVSRRDLLGLGRRDADDDREPFTMAYLAMRGCAFANGVSRLHGEVSRAIFVDLFPRWPQREVPIDHVTNGVHVPSWDSRAADELWTRACGKERWRGTVEGLESIVLSMSDEQIWSMRCEQRAELVAYARGRLASQLLGRGITGAEAVAARVLAPDALTLGFARRFAEYKRPDLLLHDPDRLERLITSSERPVQVVVAGKAHPADDLGKRLIAEWIRFAGRPDLRHRVVFLEDYDISLAEQLTQGVDVWINTPRRPWEACGTSGMKVLVNGGLNLSERDGWWAEAEAPDVGWGLGGTASSDAADADELYAKLEGSVIPEFYDRDAGGLPRRWIARMRASMARLAPEYSANRMLLEYLERFYAPAAAGHRRRRDRDASRELARWQQILEDGWHEIRFGRMDSEPRKDGGWRFRISAWLGRVPLAYVRAELCADPAPDAPAFCQAMQPCGRDESQAHRFELEVATDRPAGDFTARIVPDHADARIPSELPLIRWQR